MKPGITVSACSSARSRKGSDETGHAFSVFCSSSFTHRRKSSATWSLPRARRVEAPGGRADQCRQPASMFMVDVFQAGARIRMRRCRSLTGSCRGL
ncbi:hypothetical protein F2981_02060 [Sinorhizobium meliloti]|nr:hypothetical protein [Sinorhizobium meliloti]